MRAALSRSASRFIAAVAAAPHTPLTVAVTGPDRHGREGVLTALRQVYARAGVEVLTDTHLDGEGAVDEHGGPADGRRAVVLVNDAHQLAAAQLGRLTAHAHVPGARLVVAYRPWPRSTALAHLVDQLRRRPVVVGPLQATVLAEHLERELPRAAPEEAAALLGVLVHDAGGVPAWVDQAVTGWRADPRERAASAATGTVPRRVSERVEHELALLDDDVATYLLALASGAAPGDAALAAALPHVADAAAAASAGGLLAPDGTPVPLVVRALQRTTPQDRVREVQRSLLRSTVGRPPSALHLAHLLAQSGERGPALAGLLLDAAAEALADDPAAAASLMADAQAAGAAVLTTTAARAEATALAGDSERALELADEVLARAGEATSDVVARCVVVAATVLAHRSLLPRSAELYRWSHDVRGLVALDEVAPLAVLAFAGVGDLAAARAARSEATPRCPTLLAGAADLMADGVLASLDDASAASALPTLSRASALLETSARAAVLPDTPAALAALVALHGGDAETARALLDRAVAGGQGGAGAQPRHQLLLAWTAMVEGRPTVAAAHATRAREAVPPGRRLEPRDALVATALEVGLARRAGDVVKLRRAWSAARQQLVAQPVDLYALLPLGELLVGAARMGELARVAPQVARARQLLEGLGGPALWSAPLLWSELQAAVLAERPDEVAGLARELSRAAGSGVGLAPVLARAGAAWSDVVRFRIDAVAVEGAARGLQEAGLRWDASRLAGQAALRATDRHDMALLLAAARALAAVDGGRPGPAASPDVVPPEPAGAGGVRSDHGPSAADAAGGGLGGDGRAAVLLTDRERQVAALVVSGHTYREVGEQLFLSPKTVEHHVARMRQRLGASGRSELLGQLRGLLDDRVAQR